MVVAALIALFIGIVTSQNGYTNLDTILATYAPGSIADASAADTLITNIKSISFRPLRYSYATQSCATSAQCRWGTCNLTYRYCVCDTGYQGNNCEYSTDQMSKLGMLADKFLTFLTSTYSISHIQGTPTADELGRVSQCIRQGFKAPDAITQTQVDTAYNYLIEVMKQAQILTSVVPRMQLVDAVGKTVDVYYSLLRKYRENHVKDSSNNAYATNLSDYQNKIQTLLTTVTDTLLPKYAAALSSSETVFKAKTNTFTVQLSLTDTATITAASRTIAYVGKFAHYRVQPALFTGASPALPANFIEQIVQFIAHPIELTATNQNRLESGQFQYNYYDTSGVALTLASPLPGYVYYTIPLVKRSPMYEHSTDLLQCQAWDGTSFDSSKCYTHSISSSSIECSCRALGDLVSVNLETTNYSHVKQAQYGTYTDYHGYDYWEKSFGFLFCMVLIGLYVILYPIFYFGEKKKLNKIRYKIKKELQQLDRPAFKELDNEFKSVVALDHSRDSNMEFDQTADERSREKILRNKNIIPSSGLKRIQNKQKILPHGNDFEEDKPSKIGKNESDMGDFDTSSMQHSKKKGMHGNILREEDADKSFSKDHENEPPSREIQEKLKQIDEKKQKETFKFSSQIKSASPILNLVYTTSILLPRHVRLTIFFLQLMISIFVCAVYYHSIMSPLIVQEEYYVLYPFKKDYIMIAFIAPLFSDISMYFFAEIFRLSQARFKNVETVDDYDHMMSELNKETILRYIMAYFIVGSGITAEVWYIVKFSSNYGWEASSAMFWSSILAWGIDLVVYEVLLALFAMLSYKCWRKFAIFVDKVRKFKQATPENEEK